MKKTLLLALFLSAITSAFASGCGIPMSQTSVVPEGVAKTPMELAEKLEESKKNYIGAGKTAVMKFLNIEPKTPGVRDIIDAKEKKEILYAGIEVRGSPEEAERFRRHLERQDVTEILFSGSTKRLNLDSPISALIITSGPEFKAYLIFFDGKLTEVRKPENFQKEEKTRAYVTDLIGSALGGGMSQGLKQIK